MSLRRKLAIATWDAPREGNIYGKLIIDARPALAYIERRRAEAGIKLTLTHIAARALSLALRDTKGLNGYISRGRFVQHETVDLSVIVAINGGENLSAVKLERADMMGVSEVAEVLNQRVNRVRVGDDASFKQNMSVARRTPWFLLKPLLKFVGWVSTTLGWSIPALGVRAFPFGAAILTNVGVFGVDEAYVPPTPFAGVPLYLLLGVTRDAPYIEEGEVRVRQEITLTATMDHRFVDGAQAAQLARHLREVFADPERFEVNQLGEG